MVVRIELKKIILVSKTNFSGECLNGPTGVIYELVNQFKKRKLDFYLLNYEPSQVSKVKYFFRLIRCILFSKDCVINVHTDGYMIPFITLILSKINKKNKYYLTVHGLQAIESKFVKAKNKKNIEKITIQNFNNIICVSEMLKKDILNLYKRNNNIFVINNGVDSIYFNKKFRCCEKKSNIIRFISTGGIRKRKGIFETIELFKYLKDNLRTNTCKLDIYGPIDDGIEESFYNEIKNFNLEQNIYYKGIEKDKQLLYENYSNYDFNLCLSLYDTFNVSVIESMSVGIPAIVSNKCGAAYLIDHYQEGFIIDLNSNYKEDIYNILIDFIKNPNKFSCINENCIRSSRKFSWENICNQYVSLLLL